MDRRRRGCAPRPRRVARGSAGRSRGGSTAPAHPPTGSRWRRPPGRGAGTRSAPPSPTPPRPTPTPPPPPAHSAPGRDRLTVDVDGVRVSPFVCYDLRFADAFWPIAERTDVYLVVASWPHTRREHWRTLLRARAIENQAYVVGVNRVGSGGGLDYAGDSCIIDPMGDVLVSGAGVETVLVADIDPAEVAKVRSELPFMADRRDD